MGIITITIIIIMGWLAEKVIVFLVIVTVLPCSFRVVSYRYAS